jgi:hypothetical protein
MLWKRRSRFAKIIIVGIGLIFAFHVATDGVSSSAKEASASQSGAGFSAAPGATGGQLEKKCGLGLCGSDEVQDAISASSVSCSWQGKHVVVSMRLQNPLTESVTALVAPRYELDGHGAHGDSFGSAQDVYLNAQASKTVSLDAGVPVEWGKVPVRGKYADGAVDYKWGNVPVQQGTRIAACSPRLVGNTVGVFPDDEYVLATNPQAAAKVPGRLVKHRSCELYGPGGCNGVPLADEDRLVGRNVWCQWKGNHIFIHLTLRKPIATDLDFFVNIIPSYRIRGSAIAHGESFSFSTHTVWFKAGPPQTTSLMIDAGAPKDIVDRQLPISLCQPHTE